MFRPCWSTWRNLGLAWLALGMVGFAVGIPGFTLLRWHDTEIFNQSVGWSNILGMSASALGVVFLMIDRIQADRTISQATLDEIADKLSQRILRTDGRQLAQLLGTDELDSRAAQTTLEPVRTHRSHDRRRRAATSRPVSIASVADHYLTATAGRLLITGGAGTGKTVIALKILTELSRDRKRRPELANATGIPVVPILFNLANWPQDSSLPDWLSAELHNRFGIRADIASRLVDDGYLLPILDSLDEVDNEHGDPRKTRSLIAKINDYVATTIDARIVLTCRNDNHSFNVLRKRIRGFDELTIQTLSAAHISAYIKAHFDETELGPWKSVLDEITQPRSFAKITLGIPWMLAMAVTYTKSGKDPSALLPTAEETAYRPKSNAGAAYLNRTEQLLYRTFVETKSRHYGQDPGAVSDHLRIIARILARSNTVSMAPATEIVPHKWWKQLGEERVLKTHTWFAFLIVQLPFGGFNFIHIESDTTGSPWIIGASYFANLLLLILMTIRALHGKTAPRALSARGMLTLCGSIKTLGAIATSLFFGIFSYITISHAYGILCGLTMAFLFAVSLLTTLPDPTLVQSPTEIISSDLLANIMFGFAYGAMQVIILQDTLGLVVAACFGLCYVVASVVTSMSARYFVATYIGFTKFALPWRFAKFLRWATEAGLLRTSGTGFQFRHQGLYRYLLSTGE